MELYMQLSRVEQYLAAHNAKKIEIHSINSVHGPLIDHMSIQGKLKYYPGEFKIEYTYPTGETTSIVNLPEITSFNFVKLLNDDGSATGNGDGDGSDSGNDGNDSDNGDNNHDSGYGYLFDSNDAWKIISHEYVSDPYVDEKGYLYPGTLIDGTLVYPAHYGQIGTDIPANELTGKLKTDGYEFYTPDSYLELHQGSYSKLQIALPAVGNYKVKSIIGSPTHAGKLGSLLMNKGIQYSLRAAGNLQYKWQVVQPINHYSLSNDTGIPDTTFTEDHTELILQQKSSDSDLLDIDSIIMLPTETSNINDSTLTVEPEVHALSSNPTTDTAIYAVPVSKGYIYSENEENSGGFYLEDSPENKHLLNQYLVKLNNSALRSPNLTIKS